MFFTRIVFGIMRLFWFFWIAPKDLPFVCFNILQHNGCQKIPEGPPSTFFGTMALFKNLILEIFISIISLQLFHILQPPWVSQSPKGPPFYILSLRYSADFGRSRLVWFSFWCFGIDIFQNLSNLSIWASSWVLTLEVPVLWKFKCENCSNVCQLYSK